MGSDRLFQIKMLLSRELTLFFRLKHGFDLGVKQEKCKDSTKTLDLTNT